MSRPVHLVLSDLERAWRHHDLTPSWIDTYADKHGVAVAGIYALAHKNSISIDIEVGRNDHLLNEKTWDSQINESAVQDSLDRQSQEAYRKFRANREDGRSSALRRASKAYAPFRGTVSAAEAARASRADHECKPGCTTCR